MDLLRSLMTLAAFLAFAGILWWAYAPTHKTRFEEDGRSIFDQGDE